MEQKNNYGFSDKKLINNPKPTPKKKKKFLETLKTIRDKSLSSLNTVLDYTLDSFQEIYNTATNSSPKNEFKPNPSQKSEPVQLDDSFVTQELIIKAKQDGDTKEVFLNNKHPGNPNMIGSSLVLDISVQKIENTIKELNDKLNQTPIADNIKTNKAENNKVDLKSSSNPKSKIKPETPKPTPSDKKIKKKDIESPKVIATPANIQFTIEAMRNKFIRNQEENPHIFEEQTYETVLKPQNPVFVIHDKNAINEGIALLRRYSQQENAPDVVENSFGTEQRKIKARLK